MNASNFHRESKIRDRFFFPIRTDFDCAEVSFIRQRGKSIELIVVISTS